MKFLDYIQIIASNLNKNFHLLGKYNLETEFYNPCKIINQMRKTLIEVYFETNKDEREKYTNELNYLKEQKDIVMFPYKQEKEFCGTIQAGFDKKKGLPYVLHDDKRLYFPKHWSVEESKKQYRYFIEKENLLGGGFTAKAPHQYQSDNFKIEPGDVLLDIGCAEGLVSLDSIEKTKKTILYEADPAWKAPLKATFEPYKDKVKIINKWASDKDSKKTTTISSSIQGLENETFFVKMDIEGAEESVIRGNTDFFKKRQVKVACCTYHKIEHFENLNVLFKSWNYVTSSSNGYILCFMDNEFRPPYFRKGLIRATNIR